MSAPRLELFAYSRPLLAPVRGRVTRRGWLVRLDVDGLVGWGEAACWPGFGGGPRAARRALHALAAQGALLASACDAARAGDLDALERVVGRATADSPEARHAVELALLDLAAQVQEKVLASVLDTRAQQAAPRRSLPASVAVHALVRDEADAREAVARGTSTLKLKVGDAPWGDDQTRVRRVREVAPGAALRVDVNGAWSVLEAIPRLRALAELGVSLVEQPTPVDDLDALRRARVEGGVQVAVDEGLRGPRDLEAVLARAAADAVVLKPQALGGLIATRRLALRAQAAGLEVIVTHSLDAAVGRAGALALAAGLAGDPVCGLGPSLARDVADLPAVVGGRAPLPRGAGIGVVPEYAVSGSQQQPAGPGAPGPSLASVATTIAPVDPEARVGMGASGPEPAARRGACSWS